MLQIRLGGRPLSLLPATTLGLEFNSPLFDEEDVLSGTYSYTFTLPLDDNNRLHFGYPDVIENVADLRRRYEDCEVEDDGYVVGAGGELRVRKITPTRLDVAVGFGMSRMAPEVKARTLQTFQLGGERSVESFVQVGLDGGGNPLLVPGIVLHANATVENFEAHDYVFAPFNNHYSDADPKEVTRLNPWNFVGYSFGGMPAFGSFTYFRDFAVIPVGPVQYFTQMAPLPKLAYVLSEVFRELGVGRVQLRWPEELQRLVVLSVTQVWGTFRLADSLPALTVKELLLKLRDTIGSVPLFAADGSVEHVLLQHVLEDATYQDWSHLATPVFTDREVSEVEGHTLTYQVGSGDEVAEAFFTAPAGLPFGEPVATVADLPRPVTSASNEVPLPELRLVVEEGAYYKSEQVFDLVGFQHTVSWAWHAAARPPVDIAGGGAEVEQSITATATEVVPLASYGGPYPWQDDVLLPAVTEQPFEPAAAKSERGTALRLGFYRGRHPVLIDNRHPLAQQDVKPDYPLVTPFARTVQNVRVGEYSLQLDGQDGTVARLLGRWLELVATATPVKFAVRLQPEHLAGLSFKRKVRIHGNLYLVKHVAVQLPIRKAATVTLIPLPQG